MTTILDTDPDFDDLDEIIAEAAIRKQEHTALAAKQKRLSALSNKQSADAELERQELTAAIRRLEEGVVWNTVGKTAVFRTQHCLSCGATHTLFVGWMTEQRHRHDMSCRRLLAGPPVESLPVKREEMCEESTICTLCFEEESKC